MFDFAFDTFSDAMIMQSQNGQSHGLYVWLVVAIVFGNYSGDIYCL